MVIIVRKYFISPTTLTVLCLEQKPLTLRLLLYIFSLYLTLAYNLQSEGGMTYSSCTDIRPVKYNRFLLQIYKAEARWTQFSIDQFVYIIEGQPLKLFMIKSELESLSGELLTFYKDLSKSLSENETSDEVVKCGLQVGGETRQELGFEDLLPVSIRGSA